MKYMTDIVQRSFGGQSRIALFGSAASGFGNLKYSDIDICVVGDMLDGPGKRVSALRRLTALFRPIGLTCMKQILHAAGVC